MTNEEAVKILRDDEKAVPWTELGYKTADEFNKAFDEAYELAIKALEERPKGLWVYRKEWFGDEAEERMAWGCSLCGFSIKSTHDKQKFCPYCGAENTEELKNES